MIKPFEKPLFVTQPYLPPLSDFTSGLREIWENKWLTNNGPVLDRYTKKLSNYFENNNICLFNNGTLALQIALQGMKISGEVITTPFTFVATTHVLFWNKIRPVFVDIEPDYYTLDPEKVEAAITPWTTAILAVHVYGHPCRLDELSDIAKRHNLRLLYDAAHAFGVKVKGKPISEYGDLSMFSFHATKIYHSIEGGMLIFKENGFKDVFDYLKNFGFKNELEVVMPGTNAKMNEFQALMGELMLDHMPEILSSRKKVYEAYRKYLKNIPGIKIPISQPEYVDFNYGYMPIEIDECSFGLTRDRLYEKLKGYNIYARRYFYPLINEFACYRSMPIKDSLSVARKIAKRILTLPIFPDLSEEQVRKISNIINEIRIEENIDGK